MTDPGIGHGIFTYLGLPLEINRSMQKKKTSVPWIRKIGEYFCNGGDLTNLTNHLACFNFSQDLQSSDLLQMIGIKEITYYHDKIMSWSW